MGKADDQLVDHTVLTDRARQRLHLNLVGPMASKNDRGRIV